MVGPPGLEPGDVGCGRPARIPESLHPEQDGHRNSRSIQHHATASERG